MQIIDAARSDSGIKAPDRKKYSYSNKLYNTDNHYIKTRQYGSKKA